MTFSRLAYGLLPLLMLAAAPAHAETFKNERPIILPSLSEPSIVGIELTGDIREEGGYRIVTQTGFAIPFRTDGIKRDLLPRATIVSAPQMADTSPLTHVEMIRGNGVFQPATASSHRFVFAFSSDVTPAELTLDITSGTITSIDVRGGSSVSDLKRLFAGTARGGRSVQLSGEKVRVVEVVIGSEGVLQIDTMRLLDRPNFLFFRALPSKAYRLLSGGSDEGNLTLFPGYDLLRGVSGDPSLVARLGPSKAIQEQDDHDGIPRDADNCPDQWNWRQEDRDKDGLGDVCDPCPTVPNGEDADGNGRCDALEDPDNDGIATINDNCPTVLNRLQEDEDADGIGNACDATDDRFSANKPWLLWAGIAAMVVALMGTAAFALRREVVRSRT